MLKSLSVCAVVLAATSCPGAEKDCTAPPRWFELPPIESDYHEPPMGNECEFYRFAWQTFLFLIQPQEGQSDPRFLSFRTPAELFGEAATPRFAAKGKMAKNLQTKLSLTPRLEKTRRPEPLSSVLQANSHSTLVDQTGRAVYYAQHVNQRFADFVFQYIKDPKTGVIDPSKLRTIEIGFPPGCIELKSSWKIAVAGDDDKFFTTSATLAPFKLAADDMNLEIDTDPAHARDERVALVGIHVVATTVNHSEFIWATFEHRDNAPGAPFNVGDNDPVDTRSYTFYAQNKPFKACNLGNRGRLRFKNGNMQGLEDQILTIDHGLQGETLTQVCGTFPFGSAPPTQGAAAMPDPDVDSLNKSVRNQLSQIPGRFKYWKNYQLRGAVWIDDPQNFKPDKNFFEEDEAKNPNANMGFGEGTILRGEHRLSNPTMETFTQGKVSEVNSQTNSNCFSCHTTKQVTPDPNPTMVEDFPARLVGVSHIIVNGVTYPALERAAAKAAK
jgi:hypothetical protein